MSPTRPYRDLAANTAVPAAESFRTGSALRRLLHLNDAEIQSGGFRIPLYRFLTDSIPLISACIWTWARLCAAPGRFVASGDLSSSEQQRLQDRLDGLLQRVYRPLPGGHAGGADFLVDLAAGLFRDGCFGGFLTVDRAGAGVDRFFPIDVSRVRLETHHGARRLRVALDSGDVDLDRPDFYYIPLAGGADAPLGRSILKAIPFVAYVEQQLVEDMRRSSHNAGFHRLHVKITPPERLAGESDPAYVDRINAYFDATVSMIRSCEVDDNPVTWDNVAIEHLGPEASRSVANSWFVSHRAMIEEICAGTHLAPFLLGYSYGATTSWSGFKFDLVMRQVRSVQAEMSRLLEWIAAVDLALAGIDRAVHWEFDNTFAYQANERAAVETGRVNNLIRLYEAGLLDKQTAVKKSSERL